MVMESHHEMRCFPVRNNGNGHDRKVKTPPPYHIYADFPALSFSFFFNFSGESFEGARKQVAMINEEASLPTTDASPMEADHEEELEEQTEQETKRSSDRLMLPSDGYEWKKYGQKFIKNIGMFRSYFKCQRIECGAKKRAEWSPAVPSNIRVVYNGLHTHEHNSLAADSQAIDSSSTATDRYNLFTQVFGHHDHQQLSTTHHHSN